MRCQHVLCSVYVVFMFILNEHDFCRKRVFKSCWFQQSPNVLSRMFPCRSASKNSGQMCGLLRGMTFQVGRKQKGIKRKAKNKNAVRDRMRSSG